MSNDPVPPNIPTVGEQLNDLDGWKYSEDPAEGRMPDSTDNCEEEHSDT